MGKTSILKRVLMNEFSPKYTPTVEETHSEEFVVNGQKILVDMIDTSGAYRWTDAKFGARQSMRHAVVQVHFFFFL